MDGAGAKASRLLWRKLSPFPGAKGLPADASGAYRPNPQATTKLAPRPSSLKGYFQRSVFSDQREENAKRKDPEPWVSGLEANYLHAHF
jgi:hypothetical protein